MRMHHTGTFLLQESFQLFADFLYLLFLSPGNLFFLFRKIVSAAAVDSYTPEISSTHAAPTTALPAGSTQWTAPNSRHAPAVRSPMPPFPMISLTPVFSMKSCSSFSILIEVVGPIDTISYPVSAEPLIIGPACMSTLPLRSTGSPTPSFTTLI